MNLMYYQPWSLVDRWPRELEQISNGRSGGSEPAATDRAASDNPTVKGYEPHPDFD